MDSNCILQFEIPQLERIETEIKKIHQEVQEAKKVNQKWYALKAACILKGCNYNTVKSNRIYQPCGGRPDASMHGVKVWTRENVEEWLDITDGNRDEYLKKYQGKSDVII